MCSMALPGRILDLNSTGGYMGMCQSAFSLACLTQLEMAIHGFWAMKRPMVDRDSGGLILSGRSLGAQAGDAGCRAAPEHPPFGHFGWWSVFLLITWLNWGYSKACIHLYNHPSGMKGQWSSGTAQVNLVEFLTCCLSIPAPGCRASGSDVSHTL